MKAVGTAAHMFLNSVLSKLSSDTAVACTCAYVGRVHTGGQTCLSNQLCYAHVRSTAGVGVR